MIECLCGNFRRDEIGHDFPDSWGETEDCRVVGTKLDCLKYGGDPGIGLSISDRAEGFAECEFPEH